MAQQPRLANMAGFDVGSGAYASQEEAAAFEISKGETAQGTTDAAARTSLEQAPRTVTTDKPEETKTAAQDPQIKALLNALSKQDLTPEVQNLVQSLQVKSSKQSTQKLYGAVSKLGAAQESLDRANGGRRMLHAKWRAHMRWPAGKDSPNNSRSRTNNF